MPSVDCRTSGQVISTLARRIIMLRSEHVSFLLLEEIEGNILT